MPDWLLWLLPVPLATAAAIAWTAWSSRARGPEATADGIAAYERFRAALASPPAPSPDLDGTTDQGSTGTRTQTCEEGVPGRLLKSDPPSCRDLS